MSQLKFYKIILDPTVENNTGQRLQMHSIGRASLYQKEESQATWMQLNRVIDSQGQFYPLSVAKLCISSV